MDTLCPPLLSASTVRRLHGVFHLAMDAVVRARLIPLNPTQGVTLPKKETAPRKILNDAQLERFMEEIRKDPIWYDFFYTELTTGLRKGEICGLMWSDFDSKQGTLSVRRTIRRRRGRRGHRRSHQDRSWQAGHHPAAQHGRAAAKAEEALLLPVDLLPPASAGAAPAAGHGIQPDEDPAEAGGTAGASVP